MIKEMKIPSGYKNTILGSIPKEWDIMSLEEVAFINMGQSPDSNFYNENGEGLPLIQGNADMNDRRSIIRYYTSQLTKVCDEGDFILSVRAPVGSIGIAGYKSCIGRGVCSLKPKNIDKEYLYQILLNSELSWKKLEQGSTFTAIGSKEVKEFKIAIAENPNEQTAIANLLSTWDKAIQTTNTLIEQKQNRKKWLMQMLLSGKKRLKGFEKEKWKEVRLGDVFDERNETGNFNLPLLSVGAGGIYPQSDSIKKDTSNEDKSKYRKICVGDIGYNTMRMWQGRSALSSLEGIISPAYTVVTPKSNSDAKYYSFLFKTPHLINAFYRNSQGLVDDTLNCKYKDFAIVKTFVPPTKKEQEEIAKVLVLADKEIGVLKKKLDQLNEQKKGLMQILLTGKKRLKTNK